jgi:hypothetical protein
MRKYGLDVLWFVLNGLDHNEISYFCKESNQGSPVLLKRA